MREKPKKIDIVELLPKTMEIGGEPLSLMEVEKEEKPKSFERCQVFCYDRAVLAERIIDFYSFSEVGLLGITPGAEMAGVESGVNLFLSYFDESEMPFDSSSSLIITFVAERLCDGKQISRWFFGKVWFADGNGLREDNIGRHTLKGIHEIVFVPVPPLKNRPGTGGVLIAKPEYLLRCKKPELDRLLVGRKFNN